MVLNYVVVFYPCQDMCTDYWINKSLVSTWRKLLIWSIQAAAKLWHSKKMDEILLEFCGSHVIHIMLRDMLTQKCSQKNP
jgi:hypothetical protein